MKKLATVLSLILILIIALSGTLGCSPSVGNSNDDALSKEQQKSANLEKQVKDLQAQLAAAQKPVEIVRIKYACHNVSGTSVDLLKGIADSLSTDSDGRIRIEVLPGESVAPVTEYLEILRDNIIQMAETFEGYYLEKIPLLGVTGATMGLLRSPQDGWTMDEQFGWKALLQDEYAKWNLNLIYHVPVASDIIVSRKSIAHVSDLTGLKIRTYSPLDRAFTNLGASTVWFPGEEIYTSLASGTVDAATWDTAAVDFDMGFHEVTQYWMARNLNPCVYFTTLANQEFWSSLSEMDKTLIEKAVKVGGNERNFLQEYESNVALSKVREMGLTIQYWDENDMNQWAQAALDTLPENPTDPALIEALAKLEQFMKWAGYIQ